VETDAAECTTCRSLLFAIREDSLVGTVIGEKYRIVGEIGRGGMGIVYRARQEYLDRDVAIKVLRREMVADETVLRRFFREAKAASGLHSPAVVTIHDFGVAREGFPYCVMEYLAGKGLNRLLREGGPMEWRRAVGLTVQVCRALAQAHRKEIFHRDIKPENLFVVEGEEGREQVKILDFGIALLASANERITVTGMVCGTPHYLSPEQAQGQTVDGRTDIYSLAVVLYEMLAGQPPFSFATTKETVLSHILQPPPPLREKNPAVSVPAMVEQLMMRALSKEPEKRPQSADEFASLLERTLQDDEQRRKTSELKTDPLVAPAPSEVMRLGAGGVPETEPPGTIMVGTGTAIRTVRGARWRWWAVGVALAGMAAALALWLPAEPPAPAPAVVPAAPAVQAEVARLPASPARPVVDPAREIRHPQPAPAVTSRMWMQVLRDWWDELEPLVGRLMSAAAVPVVPTGPAVPEVAAPAAEDGTEKAGAPRGKTTRMKKEPAREEETQKKQEAPSGEYGRIPPAGPGSQGSPGTTDGGYGKIPRQ
jgi:serine/threonine-protein kinase